MKKLVKLLCMISVLFVFCIGCQGTKEGAKDQDSSESPTDIKQSGEEAQTKDSSLEDIINKDEFVLGLDDSFPPMGFLDENQEIIGLDIDLAEEVCRRMGVTLKLQPINWDAKEQELATKNIDCIWNGFTSNPARAEAMTLSTPYLRNTQVIVVPAASSIQTKAELAGKTVVLQNGSTASTAVENDTEFMNSLKELIHVKDNVKALMDLEIGGSDAVVMDEVVARYYMAKDDAKFRILEEKLADEEYVIGFRKGDSTLCKEIEKHLKDMNQEGVLKELCEKWMGEDITIVS